MHRWKEGLIASAVIAVCLYGVVAQFSPEGQPIGRLGDIPAIAMGAVLDDDISLRDIETPPKPRSLPGSFGRKATVLYTWSVACPCILDLEVRLRKLHARYGQAQGVAWIALAGEPGEELEALRAKHAKLAAFYPVLRDPEQVACRRIGLRHAGQVAVLDADGRLVYRGAIDDHWETGKAEFLEAALRAVVGGNKPAVGQQERRYGCEFELPASCRADDSAAAGDS